MDINLVQKTPIETTRTGLPRDPQYRKLLDNIQGNFIKEHGRDNVILMFLMFKHQKLKQIKAFIARTFKDRNLITTCNRQLLDGKRYSSWRNLPPPRPAFKEKLFVNFALTFKGYELLGISKDQLPNDPDPDPNHRGENLFERGRSRSAAWEQPYEQEIHAIMLLALDDINLPNLQSAVTWATVPESEKSSALKKAAAIRQKWDELATVFIEAGWTIYNKQVDIQNVTNDSRLPVEHFGFVDGISNPLFFSEELPASSQNYDPLTPLDSVLAKDPNGGKYGYGSYLTFLKLEQDVNEFNSKTKQLTDELNAKTGDNISEELTQAYVVGRFQDGTPVLLQDKPGKGPVNDFDYNKRNDHPNPDEDSYGMKCPIHAHIRKVNRRFLGREPEKTRIVRRGITYGDREIDYDQNRNLLLGNTKGPVGLLFISFQSSISTFITLLSIWAGKNSPQIGDSFDPIIGQSDKADEQPWPQYGQNAKAACFRFADVVTERGGQYFFAPSISFLKNL